MTDFVLLMWKPFAACLILTGIHVYLGVHVLERKVIFVDLALAQIAALGATVAFMFGLGLHSPGTYWCSLFATFLGAAIFSLTRMRHEKIPHEAVIGIVYAVSAAFAILILSRAPEGDEHIRHMLVGDILLVGGRDLVHMAVLYAAVGAFHWRFHRRFFLISSRPDEAYRSGIKVKLWDMVFYLTFGLVVTSSVEIAGVLLVFSFLVVPSVAAMLFSDRLSTRLLLGWTLGTVTSLAGMALSYFLDLPTGAAVVACFGVMLACAALYRKAAGKP
jgi:zinc/manganese transport system permease protein